MTDETSLADQMRIEDLCLEVERLRSDIRTAEDAAAEQKRLRREMQHERDECQVEVERLTAVCQKLVWGEDNPEEYESELARLTREGDVAKADFCTAVAQTEKLRAALQDIADQPCRHLLLYDLENCDQKFPDEREKWCMPCRARTALEKL